jgi:hypothetical protein
LFSAFESWMTTEHRKKGFPEEWLSRTYSEVSKAQGMSLTNNRLSSNSSILFTSKASIGNGTMAILAGIVSQILEDQFGHSKLIFSKTRKRSSYLFNKLVSHMIFSCHQSYLP